MSEEITTPSPNSAVLIASAVKAALGPAPTERADLLEYNADAAELVNEILEDASDFGVVGIMLGHLNDAKTKQFTSPELVAVHSEKESKRYVITLRRERPDDDGKMTEEIRTDRVDDFKFGQYARRLGARLKGMVGRRVQVARRMEPLAKSPNRSARVLVSLRDLGPAQD